VYCLRVYVKVIEKLSCSVNRKHFTSMHLVEYLLPVSVEGLQRALHLSQFPTIASTYFHSSFFFLTFCIAANKVDNVSRNNASSHNASELVDIYIWCIFIM